MGQLTDLKNLTFSFLGQLIDQKTKFLFCGQEKVVLHVDSKSVLIWGSDFTLVYNGFISALKHYPVYLKIRLETVK